ncbi:MAG: ectoine/hydroxyectoine ABC transporter substrate-binding protein EhuB [Spirulinaceae cyanobacterium RM2_2_10]|nr:ectoine/hydroxyectoine ABC transporter substrate-binding protein EhuB [Spirulinaceae cyanobacterium SM2_1_0]NJO18943.1 ectoine/hydroxyectoine ABC transporter substrate-binding protein EhuB [Spirulinaceae cyanobacterium RM2_2_10]
MKVPHHSRSRPALMRWLSLLLAATFWVVACQDSGSTLAQARANGRIRVGFANEIPYAYQDLDTGELTGEALAVARVVLAALGIPKMTGVLTEFRALIPDLKAGRFDLIAAGLDIQPSDCEQIAFSNPSHRLGSGLIVAAGNPQQLHGYDDIADNGAILGIVAGTDEQAKIQALGIPAAQVVVLPTAPSAVNAVKAGKIAAYADNALILQELLDTDDSGRVAKADPFEDFPAADETVYRYGAFGFRRQDADLRDAFNEQLAALIGTAEHLALIRPFGFTAQELPGEMTAARLCQREAPERNPRTGLETNPDTG